MRNKTTTGRGRPRGKHRSPVDAELLGYLAKISTKYEIDSGEFFEDLIKAWKNQESACRGLIIQCRKRTQDYAAFLITSGQDVIAQFPVPKHILEEANPLTEFTHKIAPLRKSVQGVKSNRYKIKDLRVGMKRINLKAQVLEISEPRLVVTNFGSYANVANALVTDETGTIKLPLWNKQIDEISVGDLIQVENANVIIFRGERQLKVNRSGKLSIIKNT